jgi:hypothetical protein
VGAGRNPAGLGLLFTWTRGTLGLFKKTYIFYLQEELMAKNTYPERTSPWRWQYFAE